MLNNSQKEGIRELRIYNYSCKEKEGIPLDNKGNIFKVLTFTEILEELSKQILKLGFSKIERVEPKKANCLIRVYQKLHYKYDYYWIYNVYGGFCYTLKAGKWVTTNGFDNYEINYSKCITGHWIYPDEFVEFNCDFCDYYVKVS